MKYSRIFSIYGITRNKNNLLRYNTRGIFGGATLSAKNDNNKIPEKYNFITDIIQPWIKDENKISLWVTDGKNEEKISYRKLYDLSGIFSTNLSKCGTPKCTLVMLPKITEWWIANLAGSWCGMIISPATSMLTLRDILYRLEKSQADCIICTKEVAANINENTAFLKRRIYVGNYCETLNRGGWENFSDLLSEKNINQIISPKETFSSDICQLFFTSGTTGTPKMVPHTQASYGIGLRTVSRHWLDLNENDVMWNISDTGWAKAAWSSLYSPFIAGATSYIHQMSKFDPEEFLKALSKDDVSVLCAPPTVYRMAIQCDLSTFKPKALRHCVSAGEPINAEVMQKWKKHTGLDIYEGFGQSETTLLCATFPGMKIKQGSMGKPTPEYDIKIIDENQNEVAPNKEGYFAVNLKDNYPIGLFKGYKGDKLQNEKVFVGDYYLTGDKGFKDDEGYLWFIGRADDVIKSSGYRIGPFEVESALLEHEAVAESAVIAVPDELKGEIVKAYVVLSKNYEDYQDKQKLIKDLQDHVKNITAPYKYPKQIEFVKSLPKTVSGKIRRVELREMNKKN